MKKVPQKKKTLDQRPYYDAWWIDSQFQYSPEQKKEIIEAFPVNPSGEAIIATIEKFAQEYLSEQEYTKDKPLPSAITAQIQELESCLENLQRCLGGLHEPTIDAIDLPVVDYYLKHTGKICEEDVHSLRKKLEPILRLLQHHVWIAQRTRLPGTGRGRPSKNDPIRAFVAQLYQLWRECGNVLPKRARNAYLYEDCSPFHTFIFATVSPMQETSGLEDIIRDILDLYQKGARRKKAA